MRAAVTSLRQRSNQEIFAEINSPFRSPTRLPGFHDIAEERSYREINAPKNRPPRLPNFGGQVKESVTEQTR
jgi:hypothetical protein